LQKKLEHYGVRENAFKQVQANLSDKNSAFRKNTKSSIKKLFPEYPKAQFWIINSLFKNDLANSKVMETALFADDTVLVEIARNLGKL